MTLLFFNLPCHNKPVIRSSLNPECEDLSSCNLGAIKRIKHWFKCKMISVPAVLVCSSLLWKAEVTTVHLTHFLFSSSVSKFPALKCQLGIVIGSKRISNPHNIKVERSGRDLGARTTLSDWGFAVSCPGLHGVLQFWIWFTKICPERRERVIFYRTDSRDRHNQWEELCRELAMLWGFALLVQWPQ